MRCFLALDHDGWKSCFYSHQKPRRQGGLFSFTLLISAMAARNAKGLGPADVSGVNNRVDIELHNTPVNVKAIDSFPVNPTANNQATVKVT